MAENSNGQTEDKKENFIEDIGNIYAEQEISDFVKDFININLKRIISDLNNYIECGDWKRCSSIIEKLIVNRFIIKYTNETYKIRLLDIIIQKLLFNIYFYLERDLNDLFEVLFFILKYTKNYSIDWKIFYTLFNITDLTETMNYNVAKLFICLHKYYSEDSVTLNEYKILVKTFFDDILNSKKTNAIHNFIYFFPKKYILEDDELQLRFLYYLQNRENYFVDCCRVFHKILRKNGKLYFSKEPKKNEKYIEIFIKYYFTRLNLCFSNYSKIFDPDNKSPIPLSNKEKIDDLNFEKSVVCILIELLFNLNFKHIYHLIDSHLILILNNNHLLLKEKSPDKLTIHYINFLQTLLHGIYRLFNDKQYDKTIGKYILVIKEYEENKNLYNRLLIILKYLSLNLEKLFLYENKGSNLAQKKLFILLASSKSNDDYMRQILQNINFEEYLKILGFFKDNCETIMVKYINKLICIMPLLLSEYVFTKYTRVRILIKDSIYFLADNSGNANEHIDINILKIFFFEFYKIRDLAKQNKIYEFLIPTITEATKKIMNNLITVIDLIVKEKSNFFKLFILNMKKFLEKESLQKISSFYSNYIETREIDNSNMFYYVYIIDEEERINLFNRLYNSLLYIDESNKIEIKKNFIYPKYDKDFNIDISKCSIEKSHYKQLEKYKKIFCSFNYSKILINDKMVKKFYELYFSLMNQKAKKYQKLAIHLFGFVLYTLLESNINEEKFLIEYPNKYHINIVTQMYKKIILPYEKIIIKILDNNKKNLKDDKIFEINYKNNTLNKQALEELLENYLRLIYQTLSIKNNIILNLNTKLKNIFNYKLIQNHLELYKKYNNYLSNSLKIIIKIYEYNGGMRGNYLFGDHKINKYFDCILKSKIDDKRIESSNYKKMNKVILELNIFKDLYKFNLINISNINNFNLINIMMPKEESYYSYLNIYLQSFHSISHHEKYVSAFLYDFYSINQDRIKNIYNNIFDIFISELEKITGDSLAKQNIMENIISTFYEFSKLYISFFCYDSLDIIEKFLKLIMVLKLKEYKRFHNFIRELIENVEFLFLQPFDNIENNERYSFYHKKNEIIEKEMDKTIPILKENIKKNIFVDKIKKNIEIFIEKYLNILYQSEKDTKNNRYNILTLPEKYFLFKTLTRYGNLTLDKQSELYRKLVIFVLNNLILNKSPVSTRILWVKELYHLIWGEYLYYEDYYWIIFKSNEEYLKYWEKLKYEVDGKDYIPYPFERIKRTRFVFDEYINNNKKYNLNLEELLISMAEIDEYEEDKKHMNKNKNKITTLDELLSEQANNKLGDKEYLDYDKGKMFYYMFKLKYIDLNSDYIKKINYSTELFNKFGKIEHFCVIYEFLLGKYEYMLENKLFGIKERDELWKIMEYFTRGIDKTEDGKIYDFFGYMFQNYSLGDLEFIFDYDFFKYPIDFLGNLYFSFEFHFEKLLTETKIFKKEKTEDLIFKIFSTEENIILYEKYLNRILKIYYASNGIIKLNHYTEKYEYTEEMYKYYMKILEKSDTKYRRYGLYHLYLYIFNFINDDLSIMKLSLQKIALCSNEFKNDDKGKIIYKELNSKFKRFVKPVDFPTLCDMIVDIFKNENDSNDTNKMIYIQTISNIYKVQKHHNLLKYSNQEIFDSLFKVFINIKKEELKNNFVEIFIDYFNSLTIIENKNFIEKYQKYIFEDIEEENKYNYIKILMVQLLRFKIKLPDYIQNFIVKLKIINQTDNYQLKKIIIDSLKLRMKSYKGSFIYMKENISEECKNVLEDMTREHSYFI